MFWLTAVILLGEVSLLLDLSNRIFGSYVRRPLASLLRIGFVTACGVLLASPLIAIFIEPSSSIAKWAGYLGAAVSAIVAFHFLFPYSFNIKRSKPLDCTEVISPLADGVRLRTFGLPIEGLPSELDGFDTVIFSDLHCNSESSLGCVAASVKNLNAKPPDVVLLLGDFGERLELLPETFSVLAQLRSRFGTFCVRGNHDFEGGRAMRVEKLAASHGFQLLRDQVVELCPGKLALVGMERPWLSRNLPPSSSAEFAIGLTHSPDNIVFFDRLNVRLGFAGHTHGGKLRLPLIGPVLVPSRFGRVFDQGWYSHGRAFLYLTPGIGYFPGRFGHIGEVVRIKLRVPELVRKEAKKLLAG